MACLLYYGGYYGMMGWWDPTYWLVAIGAVICLIASAKVNSTYKKYQNVRSASGMTGAQAAEEILRANQIFDVRVGHVSGNLTDHYDPKNKVLNLSDTVYGSTSVAAIGVAAHECGHAVQHAEGYYPLTLRTMIVPVANIGSTMAWPLIILGMLFGGFGSSSGSFGYYMIQLGIIFFSFAVLFQLVTLPVEFNASNRAMRILGSRGILSQDELKKTRKVLSAAAMTYVASAAAAILQLLRLIILFGGRDRD